MSTPLIYSDRNSRIAIECRWTARFLLAAIVFSVFGTGGCGYTGGKLLYFMGFGRGKKVEAQFELTDQPILIFIDDYHHRIDWPPVKTDLADSLAQELLKNNAAEKIVPNATLQSLQQSETGFSRMSCREVGERCGADQVIWLQVVDFLVIEEIYDSNQAAYMTVTIKVINPHEKERRMRVCLWPGGTEGYPVTASVTGSDVLRLKTKSAIAKELADTLASKVARLFYDHRLDDFGKEE